MRLEPEHMTPGQHVACLSHLEMQRTHHLAAAAVNDTPIRRVQRWSQCPIGTLPGPVAGIGRLPDLWATPARKMHMQRTSPRHNQVNDVNLTADICCAASTESQGRSLAEAAHASQAAAQPASQAAEDAMGFGTVLPATAAAEVAPQPDGAEQGLLASEAQFAQDAVTPAILAVEPRRATASLRSSSVAGSKPGSALAAAVCVSGEEHSAGGEDVSSASERGVACAASHGHWAEWSSQAVLAACSFVVR